METRVMTLDQLELGKTAKIVSLGLEGPERRRLMDLGMTPGTLIAASLQSPLRDPTAYTVRGALIALRDKQAAQIEIEPVAMTEGVSILP
jgi:Fe2+ transport system protein FeoA